MSSFTGVPATDSGGCVFPIKAFALLIPVGIFEPRRKGKEKKRETHK